MTVDQKTNEFKLTGGETIKLGRVKFTVREINTKADDENQTDYDSFEHGGFNVEDDLENEGENIIDNDQNDNHIQIRGN